MTSVTVEDHCVVNQAAVPDAPRRWHLPAVVVVSYFLLGIAAYGPDLGGISQRPFIVGWDYEQSVWFLAWIPHALSHGLNPFFTNAQMAPSGVNLAQNTASPVLGLLTVPMSWFLDPMARANVLVVLAMPLSATSAFLVLRKWHVDLWPAALGGLIFGFSPFLVDQNVELIFLALVPLIASVAVSILRGEGPPIRLGIWFGLLLAAQFLISAEIATIVLLFALEGAVFLRLRAPRSVSRKAWQPALLGVLVAGGLLAYPVWMMTLGPQHFVGRVWGTRNLYHNDVLSFVVPGATQKFSFGLRTLGKEIGAHSNAPGGYAGLLLLAIAAYLIWRSRRQVRTQVVTLLLVTAAILSLGPYAVVDGHGTGVPLPFLLFDHVPFLDDILPNRVNFITLGCLAAVIAFGLDDYARDRASATHRGVRDRTRVGYVVLLAVGALGVLIATPPPRKSPPDPLWSPTAVTLPEAVRSAMPHDDPVALTFPFASSAAMQPLQWQFDDGFQFRLLGGYAYHPGPHGAPDLNPTLVEPPALQQFLIANDFPTALMLGHGAAPTLSRSLVKATRAALTANDVQLVIVSVSRDHTVAHSWSDVRVALSTPVLTLFRDALGPPSVVAGSFVVWVSRHGAL